MATAQCRPLRSTPAANFQYFSRSALFPERHYCSGSSHGRHLFMHSKNNELKLSISGGLGFLVPQRSMKSMLQMDEKFARRIMQFGRIKFSLTNKDGSSARKLETSGLELFFSNSKSAHPDITSWSSFAKLPSRNHC